MTITYMIKFLIFHIYSSKNASGSILGIGIKAIRNKRISTLEEQQDAFSHQGWPGWIIFEHLNEWSRDEDELQISPNCLFAANICDSRKGYITLGRET